MQFETPTKKTDYQVEQGLTKLVNLPPNKKVARPIGDFRSRSSNPLRT
jgi:hypothetical protein